MSNLSAKIKEEIHKLIPPTLFFFVALHLVALIRVLMLKGTGIPVSTSLQVIQLIGGIAIRFDKFSQRTAKRHTCSIGSQTFGDPAGVDLNHRLETQ